MLSVKRRWRTALAGAVVIVAAGVAGGVIWALPAGGGKGEKPAALASAGKFAGAAVVVEDGHTLGLLSKGAKGWQVVSRIPVRHGIRSVAWMPGGSKVAVSTSGSNVSNELRVVDLVRGTQHTLVTARENRTAPVAFFQALAWSPTGQRIAVARSCCLYGARIDIRDASRGSLIRSFRVFARSDSALAWSSDGTSLYFAQQRTGRNQPKLRRLVVATGSVAPVGGIRGLDPSVRSGGALFYTAEDGIRILQSGESRKVPGSKTGDRFATWFKAGKVLLVERPVPSDYECPRQIAGTKLCSHVVALAWNGTSHYVLGALARNPATR